METKVIRINYMPGMYHYNGETQLRGELSGIFYCNSSLKVKYGYELIKDLFG
jgi:hypothetical protein